MTLPRRNFLQLAASTAVLPLASRAVLAQDYPVRPVRMIVPYPPAGPTDVFARLIAQRLSDRFGKPFVVENIAGAGGNIGTGQAAKAPADGHTILVAVNSLVINPTLYATVPFDPYKDFDPVTLAVAFGTGLTINPSVPANSVKELVALIRANAGKYSYTSGGVGTPSHLLGELFRMSLSLDLPHIPFTGSGPAIAAVVAGHVPIALTALTPALPQITSGKLRALAVMSQRKSPVLPNVPTAPEAGFNDLHGDGWIGILVPAGTSRGIVNLLNHEIKTIVGQPDVQQRMTPLGFDPVGTTPEEFSAQLRIEMEKWGKVIRAANIKPA
jgi:tripartite-type tricarboxylate transporter receptor subunit TctC